VLNDLQGVLLLRDNAPAHVSQVALAAPIDSGFEIRPYPSYSPDLAPLGFLPVSKKLKSNLRGRRSEGNKGVMEAVK
jgi:hypothetical protein